jgi:surface protein
MPSYKLTGWLEEAARILVFKESDWSLEKTEALPRGDFVIGNLSAGAKMAAGRRNTDGKVEVYGNITPILNTDFVSSWDTTKAGTSPAKTITLPLFYEGTYNFTVDYGDNSGEKTVTAYNDADAAHTYADDGTYTVTIKGQIDGFRFNNSGDKLRLIGISNWGTLKVGTNQGAYFYGCENLVVTATDILDTSEITNMSRMFSNCSVFNGSVSSFDTSTVTNMNYMFYDSMFNQSVANFNTAAVTNMNSMFRNCPMFNQSVANFNTANVTDMGRMFTACSEFNQSVANFNTTKVTNMVGVFAACSMFNQSLANFDTALVTDMSSMFYGCFVFNQSLANFDTSVVKWMNGMVSGCSAFNQSVASFDTANVVSMSYMFSSCSAFNQSVANFNTALVTDMSSMFAHCSDFNQSVANFNTSNVTNMYGMFAVCYSFNQSLANFNTSLVMDMRDMFLNANAWSQANYDATLIAWSALTLQSAVPFHAGDAQYSTGAATTARGVLTGTYGWTIYDGGQN